MCKVGRCPVNIHWGGGGRGGGGGGMVTHSRIYRGDVGRGCIRGQTGKGKKGALCYI